MRSNWRGEIVCIEMLPAMATARQSMERPTATSTMESKSITAVSIAEERRGGKKEMKTAK
jgi:hypothetical protein